jgi:hypothetical protein
VNAILNWFKGQPLRLRVCMVGGMVVLLVGAAGVAGARLFPRETVKETTHNYVVSHTEWQAYKVEVKGETIYKDRTITKYVYAPDGGLASKEEEHDATSDESTTTTHSGNTVSTATTSESDSQRVTTPVADRFFARVGLGVQPLQGAAVEALVGLDVRVAGPFYIGAWAAVPVSSPQNTAVGVDLGIRFGQ